MNPFHVLFLLELVRCALSSRMLTGKDAMDNSPGLQHEQSAVPIAEDKGQPSQTEQAEGEDDENGLMVYTTPVDYRSWALEQRPVLEAQGEEVVLMSEIFTHVGPRCPDESPEEYGKRYTDTMNAMIARGVKILNDQGTADMAPTMASIGGHRFDIGPESGITRKEYREFGDWLWSDEAESKGFEGVPERFMKFHVRQSSERGQTE